MTAILLNALFPIFAVMALGYLAGWVRDIDNHHVAELNALVMDFALPASLFVATALTRRETLLAQWPLLAVLTASMLVLYAISWWMQRRLFKMAPGEASVQALTIALPNYLAGLPLIPAVFGEADSIFVALAIAAGSIVTSPLTLAILEAQKTVAARRKQNAGALLAAVGRSFREPIVLGPIVGIVFALIGIRWRRSWRMPSSSSARLPAGSRCS